MRLRAGSHGQKKAMVAYFGYLRFYGLVLGVTTDVSYNAFY